MFDRTSSHWLLEVVARPVADIDRSDLEQIISELSADYPLFMAILDWESPYVVIGGSDERQLEENLRVLRSKISCDVQTETPQVGYRETIGWAVEVDYTHSKMTRGIRQFARIKIVLEPLADKSVFEFENKIRDDAIPRKHIASVESGISVARSYGHLSSFPIIGLKVSLVDGAYHDVDSSVMAFEIAARGAFREAIEKSGSVLLEPIVKVEVVTTEACVGDLVGDLNNRRGTLSGVASEDDVFTVTALVPIAEMFGFTKFLADLTQGRGSFSVQFSHYESVFSTPDDDPLWPEPAVAALRA